jgi:hypothetical protein
VQVSAALRELTSGNLEFSQSLAEVASKQKDFVQAEAQYAAAVAAVKNGTGTSDARMLQEDILVFMAADAIAAASAIGLTGAQVTQLNSALAALSTDSGGGMSEINADATAVNALLVQMTSNGQKISPELQALAEKMFSLEKATAQALDLQEQMPAALSGATSAAVGFSNALSVAAGLAAGIQSSINGINFSNIGAAAELAALTSGLDPVRASNAGRVAQTTAQAQPLFDEGDNPGGRRQANNAVALIAGESAALERQAVIREGIQAKLAEIASTGGTGDGGGAVEIDNTRDAFDRLLGTLDPIIAAQQKMAAAQKTVNDALAAGTITADDSANAMAMIADEYSTASDAMASFKSAGADAFDSLISGTTSLQDAIKSLTKDMAIAIAKQTLLGIVNGGTADMSIGGLLVQGLSAGFGVGAVPALDGGGNIGRGQMALVGEYGPELIEGGINGTTVTSRAATASLARDAMSRGRPQEAQSQTVVMGKIDVSVSVDDDGKIKALVRSSSIQAARQGASDAVSAVRRSLSSWQSQIERDGALA